METPWGGNTNPSTIDPWVSLFALNPLSIGCRAMLVGAVVRVILVRDDVGATNRRITRTPQSTGDRRFASALSTIDVDELDQERG